MQGNPTRIKSSREQARRLVKIAQPRGQKIRPCSAAAWMHHIERRWEKNSETGNHLKPLSFSGVPIFGIRA
jgi:hypothetical protein